MIPAKATPPPVPKSEKEQRVEYMTNMARLAYNYGFVPMPLRDKFPVAKDWPDFRNDETEDRRDIAAGKDPKNVRRVAHLGRSKFANNIGIVTGEASGVVVIDVDVENNGVEIWNSLVKENGGLPETFAVSTPSGGMHYYFKYAPDLAGIGNINRIYRLPMDYRTNSGMIVFPGSVNKDGLMYKVAAGYKNNQPIIADLPLWLKKFLVMDRIVKDKKVKASEITPEILTAKAQQLGVSL